MPIIDTVVLRLKGKGKFLTESFQETKILATLSPLPHPKNLTIIG